MLEMQCPDAAAALFQNIQNTINVSALYIALNNMLY